jgi:hypothetical protein
MECPIDPAKIWVGLVPALDGVLAVITVQGSEYLVDGTRDDTSHIRQVVAVRTVPVSPLHSVCLARASLSIRKNCAIEALQHLLNNGRDRLIVQPLLA